MSKRAESDEAYVIDLCEVALQSKASRQHRFEWLRGDFSEKTGTHSYLPVDGYWEELGLVVEYAERQHDEAVAIFDKPNVLTVSGVHRGEQRRIYDQRRVELVPQHRLTLVVIPAAAFSLRAGKILRNAGPDLETVRGLLPLAESMDQGLTPNDLARELGVTAKAVRDYLRSEHGLLADQLETRWVLNGARATQVRNHFSQRR